MQSGWLLCDLEGRCLVLDCLESELVLGLCACKIALPKNEVTRIVVHTEDRIMTFFLPYVANILYLCHQVSGARRGLAGVTSVAQSI